MRNFRNLIDVRPGEWPRVILMTLYLLVVLFAYYILKPVSRAMFLNNFQLDQLPWLYIVVAFAGGVIAYLFTRTALATSLKTAMTVSTIGATGTLVLFWWLLGMGFNWMIYLFNIFVSVFSITLVSQGWLLAANVFSTREAKRLYAYLGGGAVFGAAFGGSFTAMAVRYIGTRHLLLVSAALVLVSFVLFLAIIRLRSIELTNVRATSGEEFNFKDILVAVQKHRHLQMIIWIIGITYMVDVIVEYQFSAMAKATYGGDDLTAFLGGFFGIWLNLLSFVLQFFVTSAVVTRFGIGATLQIMPVLIGIASAITFVSPGMVSAGAARLTEASTRYSFNRTGMELLYLPLPLELRNRTKTFVDVFVDRMARGVGGLLLVFLTAAIDIPFRFISVVVLFLAGLWICLAILAKNEYVATVRKRLELRRLDLDALRIRINDPGTVRLLESTAKGSNVRQAIYALSLLGNSASFNPARLLFQLKDSESSDFRAKVYEIAADRRLDTLRGRAAEEVAAADKESAEPAARAAVRYLLTVSPDAPEQAPVFLDHPNPGVAEVALQWLIENGGEAARAVSPEWLERAAASTDPGQRRLAGIASQMHPNPELIQRLLADPDPAVAAAASTTSAALGHEYILPLLRNLSKSLVRRYAIEALASFGEPVIGELEAHLTQSGLPVPVRAQIPRVLLRIGGQRSVDTLLKGLNVSNLTVRTATVKALNKLRDREPNLRYDEDPVMAMVMQEARGFYDLSASLAPVREMKQSPAARLLARTIESRLRESLERMFRLLGLRYPPKEIYAAYLAVNRRESEGAAAALEFLDNILARPLKRVLLPLFDDEPNMMHAGRLEFGVKDREGKEALRQLMQSGDCWLTACAITAAADLRFRDLTVEITRLAEHGGDEVRSVAHAAMATLAR